MSSNGTSHHVAIIGTGFSGLCAAIKLKEAGIEDIVVFERGEDVGGTWRDNSYPGCACDVPSVLYSFSFAQNPDWTRKFAPWNEIHDYLRQVAVDYGLLPDIRFDSTVDELRFDDHTLRWTISLANGEQHTATAVISAVGGLSQPSIPAIEGFETFAGDSFHSAQWRHDLDLTGRKVAVIGSGASAIQFVPEIARDVRELVVFQRTPHWVMPRADRSISPRLRRIYRRFPFVQRLERWRTYWEFETLARGFLGKHPKVMEKYRARALDNLRTQVADPLLRDELTPDYDPGCKRRLISDEWYPALQRHNVRLVTDGIARIAPNSIITGTGEGIEVDTIVFGTGFTATEFLAPMKVFGRHGVELTQSWTDGAATKHGITTHGFPNFFMMFGPNTGLGHNSIVFMIEAQARYIVQALERLDGGTAYDLKLVSQAQWYNDIQQKMDVTVWASGGCSSWYKSSNGRIDTVWPDVTPMYWLQTRRFELDDYQVLTPATAASRTAAERAQ